MHASGKHLPIQCWIQLRKAEEWLKESMNFDRIFCIFVLSFYLELIKY